MGGEQMMAFKKGHKINLGRKFSEETKRRISEGNRGKKLSKEHIKKMSLFNMGKHFSPNTEFKKGNIPIAPFKKGNIPWNKGKKNPKLTIRNLIDNPSKKPEVRKKMSEIHKEWHRTHKHPFLNKPRSEETKLKIINSLKGRHLSPNTEFKKGQISTKMGKNFEELYGGQRAKKIKGLIIEKRKKQITPKKDTSIEIKLQNLLRKSNINFSTHKYMKEIKHGYQCDILIPKQKKVSKKTVIEAFGTYWHNYPLARKIDITRAQELRAKNFRVLTFWENEIKDMELNDLKNKVIC